ncbi:MAG: hypothetical protein JXL80_13545 [Planctomycetes bacterium]|nr:hypothetical protein [Planctomycetota bacterium]
MPRCSVAVLTSPLRTDSVADLRSQLAEKGLESWKKRSWVDVPELKA